MQRIGTCTSHPRINPSPKYEVPTRLYCEVGVRVRVGLRVGSLLELTRVRVRVAGRAASLDTITTYSTKVEVLDFIYVRFSF